MTKLNLTPAERKEHKRKLYRRYMRKHLVEERERKLASYHGKARDWWFNACLKAGVPAWEIEQRRKLLARKTL